MISRNCKRGSGKRQQEEEEEKGKVKEYCEIAQTWKGIQKRKQKSHRDWLPASSELLEIGEVVKVIRITVSKPLAHKLLNLSRD